MKLSHTLSILALLVASAVAVAVPQDKSCTQCLTEDTFCSGFAGPVGTCCDGLVCENAPGVADNAHCIRKRRCYLCEHRRSSGYMLFWKVYLCGSRL
ncbi:hypothetical protein QC760_005701 [Botrytis cinerea]